VGELPSGTVTFLFTDIEGSTLLLRRLRDAYAGVLADHGRLLRDVFARHGGHEVDTQGDSFFVAFARARDAAAAAVAAQRALTEHDWPDGVEVRVRMGLHSGEPLVGEARYVGLGVHRAARICAAGHGGQILLSNVTRELVEDDLPDDVELRDLGEHRLKDLPRPEHLFYFVVEGLPSEFPPLKTAEGGPVEGIAGREAELAAAAGATVSRSPALGRRGLLAAALMGVLAAAVAIPVFALGRGSDGDSAPGTESGEAVARVDPSSADIADVTAIGGPPSAVAAGEGAVWAVDAPARRVVRVEPDAGSAGQSIPVGNGAAAVVTGGHFVWVANSLDGTVTQVEPTSNRVVATIEVPTAPTALAYGNGALWVASATDRSVRKVDPLSGTVVHTHRPRGSIGAIAVGGGALWVADDSGGRVVRVDLASGTLQLVNVGNGPAGLAYGEGSLWVANALDGTVSQIDPSAASVARTIPTGGAAGIAVSGGKVWVVDDTRAEIVVLDARSGDVTERIALRSRPVAVAAGHDGVWVALQPAARVHRGGTLRVLVDSLHSVDPALVYSTETWSALSMTSAGLVGFRRTGGAGGAEVVADLARTLPTPSDGGRTHTFQLRPGLRYSNGAPVRASDVERGVERSLGFANSPARGMLARLVGADRCTSRRPRRCALERGVSADDDAGTVTFRLGTPDPDFLYKLALPFAFPVPKGTTDRRPATRGVPGVGPYTVSSFDPVGRLTLVRNARYRPWSSAARRHGYPDKIVWRRYSTPMAALTAVQRGLADVYQGAVPPPRLREVTTRYAGQVHVSPDRWTVALFMNTQVAPFDDVRVRRAVNHAIDREAAVEAMGGRLVARPTCQVLPPNFPGYAPHCSYAFDPTKAADLVRRTNAGGAKVTLWVPRDDELFEPLVQPALRALRRAGLDARVKTVTSERYWPGILNPGTRVQIGFWGWAPDFPSAANFFEPNFKCPTPAGANVAGLCDASLERAIERTVALQASDPDAAGPAWARLDRQVLDQAPWAPLVNPTTITLVSKRVGNYQYNPQWGVLLDQLWVR
jgi:peptide/nickel transport system substrate-binding protein